MARWFRIVKCSVSADGAEFEVEAPATEDDIQKEAHATVCDYLDYVIVEIDGPNGRSIGEHNEFL